jgi:hypothetical protein
MYIDNNRHTALWLTMMEGQQSLTLCWRWFWRWGRKHFTFTFAYEGSQKSVYDNVQPIAPQITHDSRPIIIETPLTLIFMMGQGGSCKLCCLWRQPKIPLWLTTTYWRCDFPEHMTKNHWRSIDAHFAMAVSTICNHLIWHSPSFTLFWLPFWHFHLLSSWSLYNSLIILRYI